MTVTNTSIIFLLFIRWSVVHLFVYVALFKSHNSSSFVFCFVTAPFAYEVRPLPQNLQPVPIDCNSAPGPAVLFSAETAATRPYHPNYACHWSVGDHYTLSTLLVLCIMLCVLCITFLVLCIVLSLSCPSGYASSCVPVCFALLY